MSAFAKASLIFGGSVGYAFGDTHGCAIGLAVSSGILLVLSIFRG